MQQNVVQLTQELIAMPSESQGSNRVIADFLAGWLRDAAGQRKPLVRGKGGKGQSNLVAATRRNAGIPARCAESADRNVRVTARAGGY